MQLCAFQGNHHSGLVNFFISLAIILRIKGIVCSDWVAGKYPSPFDSYQQCGLNANYCSTTGPCLVCDPDGILHPNEVVSLNEMLSDRLSSSPCPCEYQDCMFEGYPIGLAIVDKISTRGEFQPFSDRAREFAEHVRKNWFHNDSCDSNALIFYSHYFKEVSIALGTKVEEVFSDIEMAQLVRRADQYLGPNADQSESLGSNRTYTCFGLEKIIQRLHEGIANGPSVTSTQIYIIGIPIVLMALLLGMCLLANWCCRQELGTSVDPQSGKHDVGHLVR